MALNIPTPPASTITSTGPHYPESKCWTRSFQRILTPEKCVSRIYEIRPKLASLTNRDCSQKELYCK